MVNVIKRSPTTVDRVISALNSSMYKLFAGRYSVITVAIDQDYSDYWDGHEKLSSSHLGDCPVLSINLSDTALIR